MEFVERYDLDKIQYLNSLSFTQAKQILGKCKNDDERRVKFEQIGRLCSGVIKNRGMMIRQYAYSLSTPLESGGRLFCGSSIQGLPKSIRGFLIGDITTDIDIVNAHPVILLYICKKHNIHCAELEHYVLNRASVLSKFDDREKAKKLFLTSVNSNKKITSNNKILKIFDTEMKEIQRVLVDIPEYADIKDSVPDSKKTDNWNGSTINRILCMMENKILQIALSLCNRLKIEVFAPMFDGLLIYGGRPHGLIEELNSAVKQAFPGLNVKWAFKDHESDIYIPDGWTPPVKEDVKIANNDADAGRMVYAMIRDRLVYSQKTYYFKSDNLWSQDEKEITKKIQYIVLNSGIYRRDSKGEIADYTQNLRNAICVASCVMSEAMENADNQWVNRVFRSSIGYILFKNGYWDFKANKFYHSTSDEFDSNIIFMESIPFDFDESFNDEERISHVNDILFRTPFGDEVGEYYKLNIARGLAGDAGDGMKRFIVGIGSTNTGKTTISLALRESCGGYFAGWNGANVAVKNNISDEAQRLRWIMLLKSKRIIESNELSTNIHMDGNMFKKLSNGGGDDITGRMHQGNECQFQIGFLPILFAQDLPKITPYDDAVEGRIRSIPYTKTYVDEPSNDLELRKDPNLSSDIVTDSFRQSFLRLLMRSYHKFHSNGRVEPVCTAIQQSTRDIVGCEANVVDTWLCSYQITNDPNDYVLSSDIQKWLTDEKLGITVTKFGLELNRYCHIKKHTEVRSKDKKVHGKTVKVWIGCRLAPDEDSPDLLSSPVV